MIKRSLAAVVAAGAAVSGCISPVAGPGGNYTRPIGNAPVTGNPTPYTKALACLGDYARASSLPAPRIAVGRISDYTGKEEFEGGRKVTQGASLMAMSAFAKAGANLVERYDTSVSELELKYANNKLIGDEAEPDAYRRILAGSIPGSDYYLVGGITELNYNIRSNGVDVFVGDVDPTDPKGYAFGKLYVMNVGLDLRLVETRSLEVADVISYQKHIIGREIGGGYFDFLNNNVIDVSAGERALEPIQLAVRSVVERAVLDVMSSVYGVDAQDVCRHDDPLDEDAYAAEPVSLAATDPAPVQTAAADDAAATTLETPNGDVRSDLGVRDDDGDASVAAWNRGRFQ
jgi:curli production assembly/transport component CsgG/holdfast attachment protein HfaB